MKDTRQSKFVAPCQDFIPPKLLLPELERPFLLLPVHQGAGVVEKVVEDWLPVGVWKGDFTNAISLSDVSRFADGFANSFVWHPWKQNFAFAIRFLHSDKIFLVPRFDTIHLDADKLISQVHANLGEAYTENICIIEGEYAPDGSPLSFVFVAYYDDGDPGKDSQTSPTKRHSQRLAAV